MIHLYLLPSPLRNRSYTGFLRLLNFADRNLVSHGQEDAAKIVKYSKYPPLGTRGYGPMFTSPSFGIKLEPDYAAQADKTLVVIVQIESRSGVDNVEKIAAVEGLDCLFIGRSVVSVFLPSDQVVIWAVPALLL